MYLLCLFGINEFYVHGTVHPYNIVLVSNQRDAAFVLLGLLSLYTSLTKFLLHLQIPLEIGQRHLTRTDTHWWLPLQFCVLLLKMDANRARNM